MRLYGTWEVYIPGGEKHLWEPDEVTPGEELMILEEAGADTYQAWIRRIDANEAIAVQTLVWFLRRKAGGQEERQAVVVAHRKVATRLVTEPPDLSDLYPEFAAASKENPETSGAATSSNS